MDDNFKKLEVNISQTLSAANLIQVQATVHSVLDAAKMGVYKTIHQQTTVGDGDAGTPADPAQNSTVDHKKSLCPSNEDESNNLIIALETTGDRDSLFSADISDIHGGLEVQGDENPDPQTANQNGTEAENKGTDSPSSKTPRDRRTKKEQKGDATPSKKAVSGIVAEMSSLFEQRSASQESRKRNKPDTSESEGQMQKTKNHTQNLKSIQFEGNMLRELVV